MNTENILKVAKAIERLPHGPALINGADYAANLTSFNMNIWRCDSVGCIGGWAIALLDGRNGDTVRVGELFGISEEDAYALCYPDLAQVNYHSVTPTQAARVLRHLADTGEVDWTIIKEDAH